MFSWSIIYISVAGAFPLGTPLPYTPGRIRRSAFAPVFSGLYFDLKHKSGQVRLLAEENRRLLANISSAVQLTSSLGAALSNNVADMAEVLQQLALESDDKNGPSTARNVKPHRFRDIAKEYNRQAARVHKETRKSHNRFERLGRGEVEVTLAGQSVSFASTPMAAFAAGCAFNLMTVLLCILVGCRYCGHVRRGGAPGKSVSINFASEGTPLPSGRATLVSSRSAHPISMPSLTSLPETTIQRETISSTRTLQQ